MIKGLIQQEDITIVNIYAPNTGAPKYIKKILTNIKGETDSNKNSRGLLTPIYINEQNFQTENQ